MNNKDRGVAGLTVLLSVVTMLFIIGLLVMIFSLMGGEMRDATYTSTTVTATNETGTHMNSTGDTLTNAGLRNAVYTITAIWGSQGDEYNVTIPVANGTISSAGVLTNATVVANNNVSISYTVVHDADNSATNVMNDTVAGISSTTDWFDIFVVITAMVVLILLTVIIITAIRGSGLMAGGSA